VFENCTRPGGAEAAVVPSFSLYFNPVRWSELVLSIYFVYAAALALLLPVSPEVRAVSVVLNLTILAGYALLIYAHGLRGRRMLGVMRDWLPLVLMLLAYREMGWLAPRTHSYSLERSWIVVDRLALRTWRLHDAIEWLGPVVPSILEIAYSLVYATAPFGLAMLYVYGARKRSEQYLLILVLGVLLAYAQFPFWPSEPPRTVFPGDDAPSMQTVFRRFNWFLLGGYGIHTSVFPSAHVSGAFAAAFGMMRALPEKPWVGRSLLVMALLIATATVYGRYHYMVDAAAGFAVSVAALALGLLAGRSSRA
jgi:membrane-associated phospholipid phosphatase